MRILLIEDEAAIAGFIRDGLQEEGYIVDMALNGKEGLSLALDDPQRYDLIMLDWMLPGISGIEICRAIRKENVVVPIIFLSARDTSDDVVFGLETGANDYIRKPFVFEELLARIRVLTRLHQATDPALTCRGIRVTPESHRVTRDGEPVALTQKEFALLEFLMRNKGKVCRRTRILEKVWDIHYDYDHSVIDVYINFLRKKLDEPGTPSFIETVRGVGYRISDE